MNASASDLPNFVARETARAEFLTTAFVERQLTRLAKHYPSRDWHDDEWLTALCKLVIEFGEQRTAAGIEDCITRGGRRDDGGRNTSFAPSLAELRNCVLAAPLRVEVIHPQPCPRCDGTGWETIGEGRERRVRRCPLQRVTQEGAA